MFLNFLWNNNHNNDTFMYRVISWEQRHRNKEEKQSFKAFDFVKERFEIIS